MREQLIEYLLGALEQREAADVEQLLESSDEARRELLSLRECVAALEADRGHFAAPVELLVRTCERIRQLRRPPPAAL